VLCTCYIRARAYLIVYKRPLSQDWSCTCLCHPTVPGFAVIGSAPLVPATGWFSDAIPTEFSRFPTNLSFLGDISLQVDTNSNVLPLVFKHLDAQVFDLDSFRLVGTGHLNHTKLPAKAFTNIQMPLNFSYVATNDSDLTCQSASYLSATE
jgi:hypothetical protein